MPQPTPQQVHANRFMTDMAIMYRQDAENFVSDQVFPVAPSDKESNYYIKFPPGYWWKDAMPIRGLGQRPLADGYEIEKDTFFCEERALEHRIDDRVGRNADEPINPDMRATQFLTERSLIKLDREWTQSFFKRGVWGTDWAGVTGAEVSGEKKFTRFSESGSDPVKFVDKRKVEMEKATGKLPNVAVLGAETFEELKNNAAVVERIKYIAQREPAIITKQMLAALFEVEKVVVAKAVYNTAEEGAEEAIEYIADPKSFLLTYAAKAPSIETPSAGYTFAWTSLIPGMGKATAGVIFSGRDEPAHTSYYQIRSCYDQKVTAEDLGMFFSEAV